MRAVKKVGLVYFLKYLVWGCMKKSFQCQYILYDNMKNYSFSFIKTSKQI
uniref:Uncharacterized protein n=1 Tax=Anguilla anguilla TaxID=7936 RepID=A0A0E9REN5_ANGAN